jgi:hypothetical protein
MRTSGVLPISSVTSFAIFMAFRFPELEVVLCLRCILYYAISTCKVVLHPLRLHVYPFFPHSEYSANKMLSLKKQLDLLIR